MKGLVCILLVLLWANTNAAVIYSQPPKPAGGFYKSSWWDPDGSDWDELTWDSFRLTNAQAITEVRWRGAFDPSYFGSGGLVSNFTVAIYRDVATAFQPDVTHAPLVQYQTGGNGGQMLAGTFGGVTMYDYAFVLPAPFQAAANSNYWVLIKAWQHGVPDWVLTLGTGGEGGCFREIAGMGDKYYYRASGDMAFTLLGSDVGTFAIVATVAPDGAGTIVGAGAYPSNSMVSLIATPNPGFGFGNWTENGAQVNASRTYNFTATRDRTLVANFTTAFTIDIGVWPVYAGTVSGGGVFNSNATVTVVAVPRSGFDFVDWTEFGTEISTSANYSFGADADHVLVANFASQPQTVVFDLDTGEPPLVPRGNNTPFDQTMAGVTAQFSCPDPSPGSQGFSIQSDATTFYRLRQFDGNYLDPNSLFSQHLDVHFSQPMTNVALTFATADADGDTSLLQITAYTNSTTTPPVGFATARGAWLGDSFPMGILSFGSTTPFDVIQIKIPPGQLAGAFLADNFVGQLLIGPALSVRTTATNSVVISWAASSPPRFVLQQTVMLDAPNWMDVTHAVRVVGGNKEVIITPLTDAGFFRVVYR